MLGAPVAQAQTAAPVRFGVDMYSLGAQNWTPFQQLDFAAKWKAKVVHFSEIRFLGTLEPDNLRRVRARADELAAGPRDRHALHLPDVRHVRQGAGHGRRAARENDRRREDRPVADRPGRAGKLGRPASGGIDRHIDETVKVLKNTRSRARDAGIKIAIENHAGDMQARELKRLIEDAGSDVAGVCLDSGNPVWTIEDPHLTLDTLAPYVLTSHMRDSALWNTPEGAAVRWTRMGEGNIGMERYIRTYIEKCPGRAVSLEVIVTPQPRMFNYRSPEFWELYRNTPAWEFARFLALCDKGKPTLEPPADPAVTPAARQLANVEASIRWTQAFLARM